MRSKGTLTEARIPPPSEICARGFCLTGSAPLDREQVRLPPVANLESLSPVARLQTERRHSHLNTVRRLHFLTRPSQVVALAANVLKCILPC